MKLLRLGEVGKEKPAVLLRDGVALDVQSHVRDFDGPFFETGGLQELSRAVARGGLREVKLDGLRVGAPIARPWKVLGIGLNYADHAKESGMPIPPEPVVFMKASNTVVGPYDTVLIPRRSEKTDWEVELGVVIGRTARYIEDKEKALDYVAGYCVSNDVSERAFQLERGGSWDKGKSAETFNPLGPWLVTKDEIPDVQNLAMSLDVNGVRRQTGSTKTMIFDVKHLVWYLSQFMVLEAGDVITTGTPPGVGLGQKPTPIYLKAGDVMELEIQGLGRQRQVCKQA
ncbi:MAG TPA: fumarylacetoacetate hydrolase family protein [Planctomycetota bacterium]|nr:fumarylacetoacetate hydrolase family protein [Planctomycetota bacterium]